MCCVWLRVQGATKKKVRASTRAPLNHGFDDERGDYKIVMRDHLAYRYEVLSMLGKGSFGQVAKCLDHKTGELMAIKIIRNKKRFHHQALVEVQILCHLRDHDVNDATNIIHLKVPAAACCLLLLLLLLATACCVY